VLRSAAIPCGILPQRTGDRSASQVTSRAPCDRCSICPCPHTSASNRTASARSGARLVTPATTAYRTALVLGRIPWRSPGKTWARPGPSLSPASTVLVCRPPLVDTTMAIVHRGSYRASFPGYGGEGNNGLHLFTSMGLILFDYHDRVAPSLTNLLGKLALGPQRIHRHDSACKDHMAEQRQGHRHLVALGCHRLWR
jgi:hypothetical protein